MEKECKEINEKKINCGYAMFKQTKHHSRAFSCGYVYHIKVKIPVGYVTPFRNNNCVF